MKSLFLLTFIAAIGLLPRQLKAQSGKADTSRKMFIDVHNLGAGKATYAAVSEAHAKDLAEEGKFGVHFVKFWFDESRGDIYCLSYAPNTEAIRKTHAKAHGLLPDHIYEVTDGGPDAATNSEKNYFIDVHELGAGNVTAKDVAGAHQKDLAVEQKYGVNLLNYWVDEKQGVVLCLSQAPDSAAIIATHREAHGLLPKYVLKVQQSK